MNINDKRKIIFDKINEIANHNKIVNFIMYHKIIHSVNNNGYFINISILSDTLTDKLYNLVLELSENISDSVEQEIKDIVNIDITDVKKYITQDTNISIKGIKDIKINDFSKQDKININRSKNFKFD